MSHKSKNPFEFGRPAPYMNGPSTPGFSPASSRAVSGSIKDSINRFEPTQVKQEHAYQEGINSNSNEPESEPELTEHIMEHMNDQHQADVMTTNTTTARNSTTQADISQMQKDNVEKFNAALKSLLSEYMPAPLLQPHPSIGTTTSSSLSSSTSVASVPSLLEMEVRHAISQAARNVYHAHIRDDKKRKAFDFKYAELQDLYFGKGRKVAREMRRLARDASNSKGSDEAVGVGELSVGASRLGLREDASRSGEYKERVDGQKQMMVDEIGK